MNLNDPVNLNDPANWGEPLCLLTEDTDDEAFAALPECEHCDGTGKNLAGSPWESDLPPTKHLSRQDTRLREPTTPVNHHK